MSIVILSDRASSRYQKQGVYFVFPSHVLGGPGSRKGRIVDDLTNAYGCKFVCSEQLIMTELPRKLSTVMKLETIKDIKDLLEVRAADN